MYQGFVQHCNIFLALTVKLYFWIINKLPLIFTTGFCAANMAVGSSVQIRLYCASGHSCSWLVLVGLLPSESPLISLPLLTALFPTIPINSHNCHIKLEFIIFLQVQVCRWYEPQVAFTYKLKGFINQPGSRNQTATLHQPFKYIWWHFYPALAW